jgi:Flp pilus assembly protein TadG
MRRAGRGQSVVEMAMIAPVLVVLLIATIDMGRAAYVYVTLSNAVREGARAGVLTGTASPTDTAVINQVEQEAIAVSLQAAACPNNQPADPPTPTPNTGLVWVSAPASPPPSTTTVNAPRGMAPAPASGGCAAVVPAPKGLYPLSVTVHYYFQPLTPFFNLSFVMSFTSTMTTEY